MCLSIQDKVGIIKEIPPLLFGMVGKQEGFQQHSEVFDSTITVVLQF